MSLLSWDISGAMAKKEITPEERGDIFVDRVETLLKNMGYDSLHHNHTLHFSRGGTWEGYRLSYSVPTKMFEFVKMSEQTGEILKLVKLTWEAPDFDIILKIVAKYE